MTIKKDHDQLLLTLKEASGSEMERAEYQNTLETIRKQADICHDHLSVFKTDGKVDRETEHGSDV